MGLPAPVVEPANPSVRAATNSATCTATCKLKAPWPTQRLHAEYHAHSVITRSLKSPDLLWLRTFRHTCTWFLPQGYPNYTYSKQHTAHLIQTLTC